MAILVEWNLAGIKDGQLDIVHVPSPSDEATENAMVTKWKEDTPDYFPCQFNSDSLCNAVNEVFNRTGCRVDAELYTKCFDVLTANGYLLKRGEAESTAKMYKTETRIWLG